METCPHGARITCGTDAPVAFLDECAPCRELLADLGFNSAASVYVPRPTVDPVGRPLAQAV